MIWASAVDGGRQVDEGGRRARADPVARRCARRRQVGPSFTADGCSLTDQSDATRFKCLLEFKKISRLPLDSISVKMQEKGTILRVLVRPPPYADNDAIEVKIG